MSFTEDGNKHEKLFAKFLNEHGIPFLHIEQNSGNFQTGKQNEYWSRMLKNGEMRRPDFFVYLHMIGHVFIDVKSRDKRFLTDDGSKHFYIRWKEIDSLFLIQSSLFIPTWLAFTDKDDDEHKFYFITISVLKNLKDCLFEDLKKIKSGLIDEDDFYIIVPNSFCKECSQDEIIAVKSMLDFVNMGIDAKYYNEHYCRNRKDFIPIKNQ